MPKPSKLIVRIPRLMEATAEGRLAVWLLFLIVAMVIAAVGLA